MSSLNELEQHPLQILMARQPIFNQNKEVVAYELMFRDETGSYARQLSDDEATLNVLLNIYSIVPEKNAARQVPLFLKVSGAFLLTHEIPGIPTDSFVLEIVGTASVSPELKEKIAELVADGYRIALSNYDPDTADMAELIELAHFIKIDVKQHETDQLREILTGLEGKEIERVAEKVETEEAFQNCKSLGFELFLGNFLSAPQLVEGRRVRGSKLVLLELLNELNRSDTTVQAIEELTLRDPELTYKILRVVNSASTGSTQQINSLAHAITLLGMEQIRRWVMLFLTVCDEGQPSELTRSMLQRGRMCEVLSELMGCDSPMNFFFVGLLSQLDLLLEMPMHELLDQVPLDQHIKGAILDYKGPEGEVLKDVIYYERGEFEQISLSVEPSYLEVSYRHSISWASQVLTELNAGN